jgi:hypothetical protein
MTIPGVLMFRRQKVRSIPWEIVRSDPTIRSGK